MTLGMTCLKPLLANTAPLIKRQFASTRAQRAMHCAIPVALVTLARRILSMRPDRIATGIKAYGLLTIARDGTVLDARYTSIDMGVDSAIS